MTSDRSNSDANEANLEKIISIETILERYIDRSADLAEVRRILYGGWPKEIQFASEDPLQRRSEISEMSIENNFELQGHYLNKPELSAFGDKFIRLVRVGLIQHKMAQPTDAPVLEQIQANHNKIAKILDAAALANVNIVCLQETWTMPFAFFTGQMSPWVEFAESAEEGMTTKFLQEYAKRHQMVIISPILERESEGLLWNTAVVIDNHGKVIGKARKNHICRDGDPREQSYYTETSDEHPVFETDFGKIAVNISFGRHIPFNWLMYAINGAEIVFNPTAEISQGREHLWPIEARSAAIANNIFTCAINRVGREFFSEPQRSVGPFFGSSYVAAPDGKRTPGLSRIYDGLLVAELDLNLRMRLNQTSNSEMLRLHKQFISRFPQGPHNRPRITMTARKSTPKPNKLSEPSRSRRS